MTTRWLAFVIWAAVAATAVFWSLRLVAAGPGAPASALAADMGGPPKADLARLFGAEVVAVDAPVAAPAIASRFRLVGVAAPKSATVREGLALLSIDGKPARAYRVGAPVEAGLVLQSVYARGAVLGPREGPAQVKLDLPPLPMASTGTLPVLAPTAEPAPVEQPPPPVADVPDAPPADFRPPGSPGSPGAETR